MEKYTIYTYSPNRKDFINKFYTPIVAVYRIVAT